MAYLERKQVLFQGKRLSYLENNNKNKQITLLVCHANGYSSDCYRYYIEAMSKSYHVLAIDFINFGYSEHDLKFKNCFISSKSL